MEAVKEMKSKNSQTYIGISKKSEMKIYFGCYTHRKRLIIL